MTSYLDKIYKFQVTKQLLHVYILPQQWLLYNGTLNPKDSKNITLWLLMAAAKVKKVKE